MRILLVNPGNPIDTGPDQSGGEVRGLFYRFKAFQKTYFAVPLALPTLAALTPREHTVKIVDEMVDLIDFDEPFDLVGITAMTYKAPRAYQIAQEFRKRGVRTILGGIHASMRPQEAIQHADSIAINEADEMWPQILEDALAGKLKSQYRAPSFPDVTKIPPPRFDLTSYSRYFSFPVQTTRGCPNACEFCSVSYFNGRAIRRKTPQQVVREIEEVLKVSRTPLKLRDNDNPRDRRPLMAAALFIADDNFAIHRNHALATCEALRHYQQEKNIFINWFTQVNFQVGFDDELLEAMASAGCFSLFIGFESLNENTLKHMKKRMNSPQRYADSIANIRRFGMEVYYSTISGGESDTGKAGDELCDFVEKHNVFYVWPNILTPHPGTPLYNGLKKEDRILSESWEHYDQRNVVYKPALMSPDELQGLYSDTCTRLFDFDELLKRAKYLLGIPKRLSLTPLWRTFLFIWFVITSLVLLFRGKGSLRRFVKMIANAPRFLLFSGTLVAIDTLVYSLESSIFARAEGKRLNHTKESKRVGDRPGHLALSTPPHRPVAGALRRDGPGERLPRAGSGDRGLRGRRYDYEDREYSRSPLCAEPDV